MRVCKPQPLKPTFQYRLCCIQRTACPNTNIANIFSVPCIQCYGSCLKVCKSQPLTPTLHILSLLHAVSRQQQTSLGARFVLWVPLSAITWRPPTRLGMHPLTHRCVRGGRGAYTWKVSVLCVSLGVYGGVCVCTVYVYVCVCVCVGVGGEGV